MTTQPVQAECASAESSLSRGIANRLDEAMQARGIPSQSKLARLSGVPQATISRILKGTNGFGPELETLRKLAAATAVHLLWLQEGTGSRDGGIESNGTLVDDLDPLSQEGYDFNRFGDRLRYALKFRGLRQSALADELPITTSAISQFCNSVAPEGGGRYVHEISEFLGVDKLWLRLGEGEPKFTRLTQSATLRDDDGHQLRWPPKGLSALQCATLESLVKVMQAGEYNDMACVELLQELKPALAKLNPA
jgi:transcriptional regulator with XRE-family HTH domain